MCFVGVALAVVGLAAAFFGVAGGIARMLKDLAAAAAAQSDGLPGAIDSLSGLTRALTEFVTTLVAAPQWLAMVVVGCGLILFGGYVVGSC